ncbi:hypothetical protein J7E73_10810 [Paenibacillus albidus]|uniref:hypothetical protein n=1 Tax=Paenibacillus albidus TaxID=2041023 RepID=UPI001BE4F69E|nr:hypothetical protein [Paenibacillus albidus]MBT2289615.1 hypothetical protein [Paenibacillus albidus]
MSVIKPDYPLIHNKRSLSLALGIFALLILFSIKYPGSDPLIDVLLHSLGIPLYTRPESSTGLHFSGILSFALLIVALIHLNKALNRHRFLIFIAFIFLLSNAPGWMVTGYQRLFTSGVYAVELDPQQVSCSYDLKQQQLSGSCSIPLKNHSRAAVTVQPVLQLPLNYDHPLSREAITLPKLTIAPHSVSSFNPEFNLTSSSTAEAQGNNFGGFNITLDDGEDSRTWSGR